MPKAPRLAKLSAPRMARIIARPRLYRRLDASRRRRLIWIVAPPGAGKTALLATWLRSRKLRHIWLQLDEGEGDVATFFHYLALSAGVPRATRLPILTPELLAAPGAFARLFFRALFGQPRSPAVLVLEDYHEVRDDSRLHAALRDAFAELPEGVTAVVLSRSGPPPVLSRLLASGLLEVIGGDELLVTEREAREIAALWGYSAGDRKTVSALRARAEGWAAGLVLLLAGDRTGGARLGGGGGQALYDYFAQEVLERSDPDTRRLLLESALLERVEGPVAARLTGVEKAQEILAGLSRRGCFVARHEGSYRYHALFREFLLGQAARTLSLERRAELRRSAARLLEASGQVEEAFPLGVQAGAWAEAARLVRARAPVLMRQGRAQTVVHWVDRLPADVRDRDPWLLFHLGEALATLDPCCDLASLERALDLFLAANDSSGAFLAWTAIAETHLPGLRKAAPLDRWISVLDELRARFPDLGGPEVEARLAPAVFLALVCRQPWHDALRSWEERALALALSDSEPHLRAKAGRALMTYYGSLVMDLAKGKLVAEALRPQAATARVDPAGVILWHLGDAVLQVHLGRAEACLEAVERGLALADDSGLHVLDMLLLQMRVFASLLRGDEALAERTVGEMASQPPAGFGISSVYHFCSLLLARRRGDAALAREHARASREGVAAWGMRPAEIIVGVPCALAGPPESVEAELERVLAEARRCGDRLSRGAALLALALGAMNRGDPGRAVALLREGFAALRDLGCRYFVHLEAGELAECCALALEHGIEPEYVRELIRVRKLPPGEGAREIEAWPWELRVEALGDLAVIRNGERVRPGRKAQRKPLEMLRLLVAHGAEGARQETVAEALWPEADGDAGAQALRTTTYRLRRLLGKTEAIVHEGGRVALDPRLVFVDAWALERLLARIEAARARGAEAGPVAQLCDRARKLYRGDLFSDDAHPLLAGARERLQEHVARCLSAAGPSRA